MDTDLPGPHANDMSDQLWLLTVEFHEVKVNHRRTIVWRQTVLTSQAPDEYLCERHNKYYFEGEHDECKVEMILLSATSVEATPARLKKLREEGLSDSVLGTVKRTEEWSTFRRE